MASSLQRRIEDLEAATVARDGSGGGWSPLTVEVEVGAGDDEDALVDAAVEAARLARVAEGRPILPLNGIDTVIVIKTR